jgi:hypothetical protein
MATNSKRRKVETEKTREIIKEFDWIMAIRLFHVFILQIDEI